MNGFHGNLPLQIVVQARYCGKTVLVLLSNTGGNYSV